MNEISYNHSSPFNHVLRDTSFLPAVPHPHAEEFRVNSISSVLYRIEKNASTYSFVNSSITGEYVHATGEFECSWITPELAEFLRLSSVVSPAALVCLRVAIRNTYGNVQIDTAIHSDPEEGWVKPVIIVHSGIEDFDKLLDVEDSFFAKAANDPVLLAILPFVVVSQA
ncbi:MAG: hypothetical protein V4563_09480 [Pseudomonadota bacterium]